MPANPTIRTDQLLEALERILDEVRERHGAEVSFAGDHYWELPIAEAFDLQATPADFTVGQLSDDIDSIQGLLERPAGEPLAIWHELAHLCGVLRALQHLDRPT